MKQRLSFVAAIAVICTFTLSWAAMPVMAASASLQAKPTPAPAEKEENENSKEKPNGGEKGKDAGGEDGKEDEKKKTIEEVKKDARAIEGLFTLYEDPEKGTVHMAVRKKDLGKEFIYFRHIVDGIVDVGAMRGSFRGSDIFTIRKHFNRIEFVKENTSFYFDKKSPLKRAAGANISEAILASQPIVAEDEKRGIFLIDASKVFLSEAFYQVKRSSSGGSDSKRFKLGTLSKDKTKFAELRNYPENTELVVKYVYDNPAPTARGDEAVTDARYVTIALQHTLIRMPKNGYRPRYDDPRVGYFMKQVTDLTSKSATPYRDVIQRWHLVKKDPDAALSEPVEPITWWIENTTPRELRDTIKAAALRWNEAFESAGFKNAIAVKVQPDNAKWDAGDIRYNVLRWTSSPDPPFGGYGPSFINPRTGQILGADVMLEWSFVTARLKRGKVFGEAALARFGDAGDELAGESSLQEHRCQGCGLGMHLQQGNLFGLSALKATGGGKARAESKRLLRESLYYLVLHEIGHTLGLMHNMRSSQLRGLDEIHDMALTEKEGLTGSVMDYPAINFAPKGGKQGNYYTVRPGPYDHWAIEFGYAPPLKNKREEAERVRALLERSTEADLAFGNDADDMRSPGGGIDPRVMLFDLSGDAVTYSTQRCDLVNDLMAGVLEKHVEEGKSYHEVRDAYLVLTGEYDNAVEVISRWVGGVFVDRAFAGQKGATQPLRPVPEAEQKRAMAALDQYVFSPDAFGADGKLYRHLQQQRRGFDFSGDNEDPKIHDRVLAIQKGVLSHLLHRNVMKRITDSELYGNEYPLAEVVADLTKAIMDGDKDAKANAKRFRINSYRRQLQDAYVDRLIEIGGVKEGATSSWHADARAAAVYQLRHLRLNWWKNTVGSDAATRAHVNYVRDKIERALED